MTEKQKAETTRQYGVTYPDGRSFWINNEVGISRPATLPGSYSTSSLSTATDRGKFIDEWRAAVAAVGLDPATVSAPTFVSREIVKSFGETTEVSA